MALNNIVFFLQFNQVHLPTEFILSSTGDMVSTVNEKQNLPNQCFRNIKFMIVERPGKLLDHSMAMLLEYWALVNSLNIRNGLLINL